MAVDLRQTRHRSNLPFITGASDSLGNTIISNLDAEVSKLFEDRNVLLTQGGLITYTGTQVTFTEALKLEINSKIAGGAPTVIDLGSTTRTVSADGRMIYAVIDRSLGTATVTDDAATLPAVTNSNQEVFLLAKRVDAGDGTKRLYWRTGATFNENDFGRLGGVGGSTIINAIAGENITVGNAVYISNGTGADSGRTAGSAYKIDATNDARIEFIGIAVKTTTVGGRLPVQVSGEVIGLSGLTVGKPVFASATTPGDLQTTSPTLAGQWIVPVGVATSATTMAVNGAGSSTIVKITSEADPFVYTSVVAVSSNTTLTTGSSVVLVNATGGVRTITLPAPTSGKIVHIKKTDSSLNGVIISPPTGTIDGAASKTLAFQYDSLTIVSDGTNFFII